MSGREKILEAATRCFLSRAYNDVGVAEILEQAGVQPPTLYHHFARKEGLYVEWAEAALLKWEPAFAEALDLPVFEAVSELSRLLIHDLDLDLVQMLKDINSLVKGESKERLLAAYYRAVYEPLCAILLRAQDQFLLQQAPLPRLADVFLGGAYALRSSGSADAEMPSWYARWFLRSG